MKLIIWAIFCGLMYRIGGDLFWGDNFYSPEWYRCLMFWGVFTPGILFLFLCEFLVIFGKFKDKLSATREGLSDNPAGER